MQTLVITGSTKGIGRALAKQGFQRGLNVVLSGRDASIVEQEVRAIRQLSGGSIIGHCADVTDIDQVRGLWQAAIDAFGRVDIWINNAGLARTTRSIVETDPAEVRSMLDTNMLGTINGCQVAASAMVGQGGGKIFNVLGGGSDGEYFPGMGIYGTTKRGLDYLTRALAKELADTPVLVGRVRPGMIVTEGVIREIHADPGGFQRGRRTMNILCDLPDTVAPYLLERMLATQRTGEKIAWLSGGKIARRFLMARFRPRADIFSEVGL